MKGFNDKDIFLTNDYGKRLLHEVAASLPIIDPHNHIDPSLLSADGKFDNLYTLWIRDDPYKHRAMRIFGIPEELITGDKPDYKKFLAWSSCLAATAGNPLFNWSTMELKRLFGIEELLNVNNASSIWDKANALLRTEELTALNIVKLFKVELLCTSDDLTDSLEHHRPLAAQPGDLSWLPSLRGDHIIAVNQPSFYPWLIKLEKVSGTEVTDLDTYKSALISRINFFDNAGCLLSDHSLDSGFCYQLISVPEANDLFQKILSKEILSDEAHIKLQSHLLHFLAIEYSAKKWKMQLHIGAQRFTSSALRTKVGPAGGYACIGNTVDVYALCRFLDDLDKQGALPKTILYTLNPADNAVFASITGSYAESGVRGKIQYGSAWWYNDHYEGIRQQLLSLSSYGLLSTSIGMTTDSRSIVSFLRHDYYRRILCNLLGGWVEEGRLPDDWDFVAAMVQDICYYNVKNWLKK